MRGATTLLLILAGVCGGVEKKWIRTWDMKTLDNWEGRRAPCPGRAAILPRHPEHSIFLDDDISLGSLELPIDGELILGEEAHTVFDQTLKSSCKDAKWTHHGYDEWWDPDGWEYPGYHDPTSSPVPHVHRVPCRWDTAIFVDPKQSLYSVHLSAPVIKVLRLTIGDKNHTTSELAAYARTTEGSFRFVGASSSIDGAQLYVEDPGPCVDVTGCHCTNQDTEAKICGIKAAKCPPTNCDSPKHLEGFCCPVCGAEVTISHNGTLPLQSILTLLKKHLKTVIAENVQGYAAKMNDGLYHVYFTSDKESGDYQAASKSFKSKFERELNTDGSHAAMVTFSGNITPTAPTSTSDHLLATFIALTICFALAAAVYYFKQRRAASQLSFMFRRLESSSRRVSVVSHMGDRRSSTSSNIFTYTRDGGLRFQNPIFNQSMASLSGVGTSVINEGASPYKSDQIDGQRENPVYDAYEQMSPEERQANEETLQARERILEAAGDIAAVLESAVQDKDRKPEISKKDLEVITEEKEVRADEAEESSDSTTGDESKTDPLGISLATFPSTLSLTDISGESPPKDSVEKTADVGLETDVLEIASESDKPDLTSTASEGQITEEQQDSSRSRDTDKDDDSSSDSAPEDDKDSEDTMDVQGFVPLVDLNFEN